MVGAAQALALNPGTSRSGITITGARQRGFDRDSAVRLSFLMGIPVTAGAVLLKGAGLAADGIPEGLAVPMVVGIVTSGVSGWFAVWGLLRFVRTRTLRPVRRVSHRARGRHSPHRGHGLEVAVSHAGAPGAARDRTTGPEGRSTVTAG